MKKVWMTLVPLVAALPLLAADAKSDLGAAIKNLGGKDYSWKTSTTMPEGARWRMGPTEGKTQKGLTHVVMSMGENKLESVMQGEKVAFKNREGEWQSAADAASDGQGRGGMGMFARNLRLPATEAAELLQAAKELKKDGDAYAADLTEDGVKKMLTMRRGGQGGDGPTIANPKGNAKFWVKDGVLTKYEYHLEGTMSFNNNEREVNRTTTVEIKDIGSTKVEVPEAAKAKLS